MNYYLFRFGDKGRYTYRIEKAETPEEACKKAFGVVLSVPHNGNVVYKDIGRKSPKYATQKTKQTWYNEENWLTLASN